MHKDNDDKYNVHHDA